MRCLREQKPSVADAKLTLSDPFFGLHRINKKGSQKDSEQKKSGNYFFYDEDTNDDGDVDDDDL